MSRFDYVKYDDQAAQTQLNLKFRFEQMEAEIVEHLKEGRARSLAMTKLEEAYMWIGKAIRDEQIQRNGSAEPQEGRTNS